MDNLFFIRLNIVLFSHHWPHENFSEIFIKEKKKITMVKTQWVNY